MTGRLLAGVVALACVASACAGGHARRATGPTTGTTPPRPIVLGAVRPRASDCAYDAANEAITGAYATASAIGWPGNAHGVVTCLGGRFAVQGDIGRAFGFGIYAPVATTWTDAAGSLPAQVTSFDRDGVHVAITEFADRVAIAGRAFVAVYCRVAVSNPTAAVAVADPAPSRGLVPLAAAPARVAPHASATHDYVLAVDRFGASYPWPSAAELVAAGGFDAHFAHMRAYWDAALARIAAIDVPDPRLVDAYKSGYAYTLIARSGIHSNTGVNNYAAEFSHDVVGILANLFTQGDYQDAHALLLDARDVVGSPEYVDGLWTYSWPWAVYLEKTGDVAFAKANFSTSGPRGASQPSIEASAHAIAAARTGPGGVIGPTGDIDSDGLWTVDDFEALAGLAAYRYVAQRVGATGEAAWAGAQYGSLLAAVDATLTTTMRRFGVTYLPCSLVEPNSANRCREPRDANWAAPMLFGRWPWDASLLGAPVGGVAAALVDPTYAYGFARLAGVLPRDTFGGYPSDWFSSGYNAGYGSGALSGTRYRDEGILAYEFMIDRTQSGPYSWWESVAAPSRATPWAGSHPSAGQGSSPHAWGIANADKVLLDSLVAQASDGTLIVGRGVPAAWLAPGRRVAVVNFPTLDGRRADVTITSTGTAVTLVVRGAPGAVRFEVPAFAGDVAAASAGTVDGAAGSVVLPVGVSTVTVRLRRPAA